MSKIYGVTPQGVNIKRLDTILDEIHDDLTEGWGINTRLNPQSFLNVQTTIFADKIAELWEFGEQVYHAMYPFSAEGASLDNATQFGGTGRDEPRPTFYPIHAECIDGTLIPAGSIIRTNTNPSVDFLAASNTIVSRGSFNMAKVRVATVQASSIYTIALRGVLYSYNSGPNDTAQQILEGLMNAITTTDFEVTIENGHINISDIHAYRASALTLSGNLTTVSITGIVNYASEEYGEIALPERTITEIVTVVNGLISVVNLLPHIAGRLRQTDAELRQAYIDRIFNRSTRMIESIRSAILQNVQGVSVVAGYENDTNDVDEYGRWPHCVEMVVDGGGAQDIAYQIQDKKAGGIQTFGDIEIIMPGNEGEPMPVRFNRPEYVHVWFRIGIKIHPHVPLPPNYVEAIQEIVTSEMSTINPGMPIIPQWLIEHKIYANVPGISFIDTTTFGTTNPNEGPGTFSHGMLSITPRQRAVTSEDRIEVVLIG